MANRIAALSATSAQTSTTTDGSTAHVRSSKRNVGLRALVARRNQLGRLHSVRPEFLQAEHRTGLALVRRLQRLPDRALHGNVRLSAHDLPRLGVAAVPLPRRRLARPRFRPFARDDVRLERQSASRPLSPVELGLHLRRLLADLHRMVSASCRAEGEPPRHTGSLCLCAPSAICRFHPGDAGLPAAVADAADACHVSGTDGHVCAPRPHPRSARRSRNSATHIGATWTRCRPSFPVSTGCSAEALHLQSNAIPPGEGATGPICQRRSSGPAD